MGCCGSTAVRGEEDMHTHVSHTHVHAHAHAHTRKHAHAQTHIHTQTHKHTHMHTHTHVTYIHGRTHTGLGWNEAHVSGIMATSKIPVVPVGSGTSPSPDPRHQAMLR